MILERLREAIEGELHPWAAAEGWKDPSPVVFNAPPGHVRADVSVPWPLAAAKRFRRKPLDIADEAAGKIARLPWIQEASSSPPGFVNIRLKLSALTENLSALLASPGRYGGASPPEPRRMNLEFVSANPTGPVHLASGRAASLGDSLARILRRRGHTVATENYVNNMGRQVELLGLSIKARFDGTEVPDDGYRGDYVRALAKSAPADAAGWDPERFSRFGVDRMLAEHRADMEAFGVVFDRWFLESELHEAKALDKTLDKLKSLGRIYEKDGAVWLGSAGDGSDDDKDRVLVRSDGRPTYFLADIAYHGDKLARGFTELVDIWGADHHGYVPRMKEALAALGLPKDRFHLIIHQLVHLFRGKESVKMSKRAGEFVTLWELVEEVGLDACRFFFASRTPNSHLNFDIELAKKKSNENPVYYVQYVHARCSSIFREAEKQGGFDRASEDELALLDHPAARAILLKLARFPETLRMCERDLSPHHVTTYLMELAGLYHPFYEQCRVVDKDKPDVTSARLALCSGVRTVIKEGLGLLGASAPEQM